MLNETVKEVTLYGEIEINSVNWEKWFREAKNIVNLLGYQPNYFSIKSDRLDTGKVMRLERNEKKS